MTPDSHYLGYYALLTMNSINMGKLIQTFADYYKFDFEEEVAVAVRRNFQRSPELSEVLSGATDQLAPIMGIDNEMVETPATNVQKVDQVSNPEADTKVKALIDQLKKKVTE